jgi:NAD(P)-dependent dehydrogenase (short-subunit alcohol dehydrogenase family)
MKLKDRIALITGGNGGIGLAAAKLFLTEGARVVITGRNQEKLDRAVVELNHSALAVRADLNVSEEREALFAKLSDTYGKLDILFANAGTARGKAIADTTKRDLDEILLTNVTAVFLTIQASLPLMSAGAAIVVNGSVAGKAGFLPGSGAYPASKHAVLAMVRSMSAELAPQNIRINVLAPGYTATGFATEGLDEAAIEARTKALNRMIPVGRMAHPDEIARAALFLASDDASYMHGAELAVDGGVSGATFGAAAYRT